MKKRRVPRKLKKLLKRRIRSWSKNILKFYFQRQVVTLQWDLFQMERNWRAEQEQCFPLTHEQVKVWQQRSEGKLPERIGYH